GLEPRQALLVTDEPRLFAGALATDGPGVTGHWDEPGRSHARTSSGHNGPPSAVQHWSTSEPGSPSRHATASPNRPSRSPMPRRVVLPGGPRGTPRRGRGLDSPLTEADDV